MHATKRGEDDGATEGILWQENDDALAARHLYSDGDEERL